jgi:hypothetical protein
MRVHRGFRRDAVSVEIADRTGPLGRVTNKRVICIADCQNLECSARDLGFRLSWVLLAEKLVTASADAALHVVFSDAEESNPNSLTHAGWTPHVKRIERNGRFGRGLLRTNADHLFSFTAGVLAISSPETDLVLLGTGDGDLALDVAQALVRHNPALEIATLSLAGSTSQRLEAGLARDIDANLEIGLDCLQ